jgi:predicted ATP-grasp superfamily ATP-dependent carboligase
MNAWRAALPVMVTDAQALGSLAVIRSLGRAGYPVIAVASSPSAIGLHSRYVARRLVAPPYRDPRFAEWLRQAIRAEGVRAIVPSEGCLHAIRPAFAEFQPLLPLPADESKVYASLSKFDFFRQIQESGKAANVPPFALIGDGCAEPDDARLDALGQPIFAKFDAAYGRTGTEENLVVRLDDKRGLPGLLRQYRRGVLQGYCPGIGVGAFFLRWRGQVLAQFMHRRIHEVPHTGGASSFRSAWWHAGILEDARRRLEEFDWEGVAMLEYRWDPQTDRFWLLELNARFWGSLHLALFAGVDFPRLLLDAFFDKPEACTWFRPGVSSRWTFPREVEYVRSCMKDPSLPAWRRIWPVAEFFLLGLDPRVRSDLLYPGDRGLYMRALRQSVAKFLS